MSKDSDEFLDFVSEDVDTALEFIDDIVEVPEGAVVSAVEPFIEAQDGPHRVWEEQFLVAAALVRGDDMATFSRISEIVRDDIRADDHREWRRQVKKRQRSLESAGEEEDEPDLVTEGVPHFRRGDDAELALHLLADITEEVEEELGDEPDSQLEPVAPDREELYRYRATGDDAGTWSPMPDQELSARLQDWSGAPVGGGDDPKPLRITKSRVVGAIRLAKDRLHDPDFFDAGAAIVGFDDKAFEVTAEGVLTMKEHAPENRIRTKIPVQIESAIEEYDERKSEGSLEEIRFFRFLDEVFGPDEDAEEKIDALGEFVGSSLFGRAAEYQTAIFLKGDGANGKSVFLKTLQNLFPAEWVCEIPPQDLGENFKKAAIGGKRLNVVSEVSDEFIRHTADIKQTVDGHRFTASRKHQPERTFQATAGHIFSVNELPRVRDVTDGFWRAVLVIPFKRRFRKEEQDPRLVAKLEEDLELIAAWAIDGYQRLARQGAYTIPPSSYEARSEWRDASDNARLFLHQRCQPIDAVTEETPGTPTEVLYRAYKDWCMTSGHQPVADNRFGERLRKLGHEPVRKQIEGEQKVRRPLRLT